MFILRRALAPAASVGLASFGEPRCCDDQHMGVPTPNPMLAGDVLVLLAVLSRYEGELRSGAQNQHAVRTLGERCQLAGLLAPDAPLSREVVARVLEDVGQRLRLALGEYDEDPTS